ncbi:MAG: hypothetical protein R6X02_20420 [Enhygromyxa sp.]
MAVDSVRVRSLDDVVIAFFEPERELDQTTSRPWLDAVAAPGIRKCLSLTVGPVLVEPGFRRELVAVLDRLGLRVVAVTDNRLNRGLIGTFGWLGLSVSAYPWSQLDNAARDVASRPELIAPIVRVARALRAESPAAAGLPPDEG